MRNILVFVLLMAAHAAFSQSDIIINTTTLYIAEGKYDSANYYLDSLIKADPKNIDALMMKGNVLLNDALMQTPPLNNITLDDESIYSEELASLQSPIVIIPRSSVATIEKVWYQCLAIDSGRLDIREGLCTTYGMADMKNELLDNLPATAKAGAVKGPDFVYILAQYADLLSDRGDKEGAYAVYKKLLEIYPDATGLWCLLAEAYHTDGDLKNAHIYADKGLDITKPDIAICSDALDIYTTMGEYEKELALLKKASQDSLFKDYPFYSGIYKYAHRDAHWKEDLNTYIAQFAVVPDSNMMYNAASFMVSKYFTEDYEGFASLLRFSVSDLYVALLSDRGMHDFKDSVQPYLIATQVLIHDKNYAKANTVFASLEKKKMEGDAKIDFQIQYGFSLYAAGDYAKAIALWSELNKMPIPYLFATSNYFLGQCYLKTGNKAKATEHLQALVASTDETKYAFLAKVQLDKIKK